LTASGSGPDVREGAIGDLPCLIAGEGSPLVVLAGPSPDTGGRRVFYLNRRAGLPAGMTMAMFAAEDAAGLNETFAGPVDVVGVSTGGSIAQQLAADHPDAVGRLVLVSTACRLGPAGRRIQRQDLATTIEAEDGFDLAACGIVRSPTLLIAGAEDRFYERELFVETAALIPDCRLSLYPNRGHVTATASPRAIAEATGFLNAGRPTAGSDRPARSG
jgi:pimeloyl-ACP methyl ester carboxylesterase